MIRRAFSAGVLFQLLFLAGCVMHAGPPGEVLVVVSRCVEPHDGYELRVIQPGFDREVVSNPVRIERAVEPPLPTAVAQDGAVVLLVPTRGAAPAELRWIDPAGSADRVPLAVPCAQLLEACETRVAVIDRAPRAARRGAF